VDITGVREDKPVVKILRGFCRVRGLDSDQEAASFQLGRCSCHHPRPRSSALIESEKTVAETGLRDGDYVFVRRRVAVEVEGETENPGEFGSAGKGGDDRREAAEHRSRVKICSKPD